jgi:hypothetical protein
MKPNDVDIARVRRPQRHKLHLGIYQPPTALACQADSIALGQGSYAIPYDNVTSGWYTSIKEGMTCYVGSTPGSRDLGRIRVRSASASTITVSENSDILWADDVYLTIVRFFEPWAVYPRIVLNSENVPTFYKDFDITYTDQNQLFDPVVHLGPHTARIIKDGAASIFYSSSGTFDPTDDSSPTGHEWFFEGGDITGSLVAHPGLIDYSEAGQYTTHLEVTSNFGKTFEGHRHVMIFDDNNPPISKWGFVGLEGSRAGGGYSSRFWLREDADFEKVVDGALVVVFSDDWYGDEKVSVGGMAVDRSNIVFVGYIEGESVGYNYHTSKLEFRVASLTGISDLKHTFSASLESKTNTSYWYEMQNMTVDKAMVHYLRWQTTLLAISDFNITGDIKDVQYMDFSRSTIYSEISTLYESAIGADFVADRQGTLWAEIDVNLTATGSRSLVDYPETMELERRDWLGEVDFGREIYEVLSYIEAGGIAWTGPDNPIMVPLLSGAPGEAPAYAGGVARRSGLVLDDQDQLNEWAGLEFARMNSMYPRLDITLIGDYRFIDIAPQEFLLLTLEEGDTYRKIIWDRKRFLVESVGLNYNSRDETLLYELALKEETSGPPGETLIIPIDPPFDQPDLPEWEIQFPPIQPLPPILPPVDVPEGTGQMVYITEANRIVRCVDILETTPTFEQLTEIDTTISGASIVFSRLDPEDPQNTMYVLCQTGSNGPQLWRFTSMSTTPVGEILLTPAEFYVLTGGGPPSDAYSFDVSKVNNNIIYVVGDGGTGGVTGDAFAVRSTDRGVSWQLCARFGPYSYYSWKKNRGGRLEASEHSVATVHTTGLGVNVPANSSYMFRSDTIGTVWTGLLGPGSVDTMDYHIPFHDNGDQIFVWSNGFGNGKSLRFTDDSGQTFIDVTPEWDLKSWAVTRTASNHQHCLVNFRTNRNFCAAWLGERIAESDDQAPQTFFASTTGWSGLKALAQIDSGMQWLEWNYTNANILYAIGRAGIIADDMSLVVTTDGGLTWADHADEYRSQLGLDPSYSWTSKNILHVWTV